MNRRIRAVVFGVIMILGGATLGAPVRAAAAPSGWRTLTYHGAQISVPEAWPVVDLTKDPDRCPRLDAQAVYLGSGSASAPCPADAVGRSDAIRIQPLDPAGPDAISATVATTLDGHAARMNPDPAASGTLIYVLPDVGLEVSLPYLDDTALLGQIQSTIVVAEPARTSSTDAGLPSATVSPATVAGTFTGRGFDPCAAPSTAAMNAWLASPYRSVGVYIGGINRACAQANLSATWINTVQAQGWSVFPIYVGRQAPCTTASDVALIDAGTAASQGQQAADDAAAQAHALGLPAGAPLIFDMEQYGSCAQTVLTFLNAYDRELHTQGYAAGVYESFSNVNDLLAVGSSITQPDVIDYAAWDGLATTDSSYLPSTAWPNHHRIHQYLGGHSETWGGVTIDVDSDQLDVNLGGTVTRLPGSPAFVYQDQQHVFAQDVAANLYHWVWAPGGKVQRQDWGGDLAGEPVGFVYTDQQHVFARDPAGHLHHWVWAPGGKVQQQDWVGDLAGDPAAFVYNNEQHVFGRDSAGHLHHWVWAPGGKVQEQDWGGTLAVP